MKYKSIHIIYAGLGGHFDYVFNLIQAMRAESQTFILFFGVESVPADYLEKCKNAGISNASVRKSGMGISAFVKILGVLRRVHPDLIYVHSNTAVLPVKMYQIGHGSKLIFIEHHNNDLKTTKDFKRSKFAQTYFDKIIFLTDSHREQTMRLLKKQFQPIKSVVIRTGIPESFFSKKRVKQSDKIKIGMQSRLVEIKDHKTLIKAFCVVLKEYPDAELRIAGDGTERKNLENLVSVLNIQSSVFFEGMLKKNELSDWLEDLTIYVHATFGETSSIALMEAMAKCLPIIASNVSGVNDFLKPEMAILVAPKDVEALSSSLIGLMGNAEKKRTLSENAFNFAQTNCSLETMSNSYIQLESELLKTE